MPTWGQISGRPSLATVATSGNYNDLSNKPIIPGATTPLFNTYISAYDYDIRTTAILNQGRARFIVVISTSANNSGFKFNGNRISGPNLNNIENWISYFSYMK